MGMLVFMHGHPIRLVAPIARRKRRAMESRMGFEIGKLGVKITLSSKRPVSTDGSGARTLLHRQGSDRIVELLLHRMKRHLIRT
jgi:hypothetical protein